jgi:hypothetical protein
MIIFYNHIRNFFPQFVIAKIFVLKNLKRSILFAFLLLSSFSFSQSNEEGLKLLKEIFEQQRKSDTIKSGQVHYIKYKSQVVATTPDLNNESSAELWQGKNNYCFKTVEAQIYADKKDMFMLIPSRKLIYRNSTDDKEKKMESMQQMFAMQDSMFSHAIVSAVHTLGQVIQVELTFNEKGKAKYQLTKIMYELDPQKKIVLKTTMYYLPERTKTSNIKYVAYTFLEQSAQDEPPHFKNPVAKKFLKGEKLNEKYKAYKLIDTRAQKTNK